ncbi:MAG TPA: ABC transporter substrate-binding protein [Candidatus Binatia bacterium]|jgi:ABC-type nitrate/sulfonate/bicarbonate transport system substrate-binding protein
MGVSLIAGYATIGQGAGPLIVTERAGIFARHGLDVKTRIMGGAKGVVRGLMEGEILFGNLAAPALLRAGVEGTADLVFLTGGINQQFLVARPRFRRRGELDGARIGFVGDGGLNDLLVRFIIERFAAQGIRTSAVRLKRGGERGAAPLFDGSCDALVMTPPEAVEAKMGGCPFVVDFAEFGFNYALGGIAARRRTVEQSADLARRFVTAYVEGMHCYRNDREFTITIQQEYSGIADRAVAEGTYDLTRPGMPELPYPVVAALGEALKMMSPDLPAAATADPRRFVDDRFVRELDEAGFVRRLTT